MGREQVSGPGEIAPKREDVDDRHLRHRDADGNVHKRSIQWGDRDDGLWITADEDSFENLYAQV
jgi:hypothetical protein